MSLLPRQPSVMIAIVTLSVFVVAFLMLTSSSVVEARVYNIQAKRVNGGRPLFSQPGDSSFKYNYNAAWIPATPLQPAGLLVRCQNRSDAPGPLPRPTPSQLAFAPLLTPLNQVDDMKFGAITDASVIMKPTGESDNYGDEDPRIVYNAKDGLYYLMYTEAQHYENGTVLARLCYATSATPSNASTWVKHGVMFPNVMWSKSGSLLLQNGTSSSPHILLWGDSSLVKGMQLAVSTDLKTYTYFPDLWLPMRSDSFDSGLVEGGPMPLPLSDGNYLYLYNSARHGYPSPDPGYDFQYNIGAVILDGKDPSKILQRTSSPILSPEMAWEKAGLTANVVFVEGWTPLPGVPDSFIIWYGAADTVIGAAIVTVT